MNWQKRKPHDLESNVTSIPLVCIGDAKCSAKGCWSENKIYFNFKEHDKCSQQKKKKVKVEDLMNAPRSANSRF